MSATKAKRPAKGPSSKEKGAARQRAAPDVSLTAALAEAAWRQADGALARALADFDEAETAETDAARAQALARLGQSLAQAGRKRGLARIGELGGCEPYDQTRHELNLAVAKTPKTVCIQARGAARGGEVLEKPRVAPVERKRR